MTTHEIIDDFYRRTGGMTASLPSAELETLPREIAALCQTVQGLLLHEHWAPAYHETLSPRRRATVFNAVLNRQDPV